MLYIPNLTSLTLPEGLESIGGNFINTKVIEANLDELTIPASVTHVIPGAFAGSNIKTINIEGSTENWDPYWNNGYTGTINYLNS